jgi:hypothetical protein
MDTYGGGQIRVKSTNVTKYKEHYIYFGGFITGNHLGIVNKNSPKREFFERKVS